MGLWMKCPGCQAQNPLYVNICSQCGQALDNLPQEQRVYVLGVGPAAPAKAAAKVQAPEIPAAPSPVQPAEAAPKPAKKPRGKKKKG
jgi:hypothetical protein